MKIAVFGIGGVGGLIGGALALTLAALAGYIIQFCSALRERKPA